MIVGSDQFVEDKTYLWVIDVPIWKNKSIVQNAMHCSEALYQKRPYFYLQEQDVIREHCLTEIVVLGNYHGHADEGIESFTRFIIAKDNQDNLFIAFRGSSSNDDWEKNTFIGMSEDHHYGVGRMHRGFLRKANNMNIENIEALIFSLYPRIVVCTGHSQGGAVSSLVHLRLLQRHEARCLNDGAKSSNIEYFNFTFGSPMFGNYILEASVREKKRDLEMFHFVNTADIVPAVLSIGHFYKNLKKANPVTHSIASAIENWISINSTALKVVETVLNISIGLIADPLKKVTKIKVSEFKSAYYQLRDALQKESTIFNQYNEKQYVPIGNYIFLHQTGGRFDFFRFEQHDSKLNERILTASTENLVQTFDISLIENHFMLAYKHKLNAALNDFEVFPKRALMPFDGTSVHNNGLKPDNPYLKIDNLTNYFCGLGLDCQINQRKPLHDQKFPQVQMIGHCITCNNTASIIEFFFHKHCLIT